MAANAIDKKITRITTKARTTALEMQDVPVSKINQALKKMAVLLRERTLQLQKQNQKDLNAGNKKGLSSAMLDRLTLSDKTINSMIQGLKTVARINSPVGTTLDERTRPNGLKIYKMKVPIGVIGIIYESRPNVTVDAAAICLKSQNAVILRGGSEAYYSNTALVKLFQEALDSVGVPQSAVQLIPTTSREAIDTLLSATDSVDLIIPRGGEGLIRRVVEKSQIPVIKHYKGICHTYVSRQANHEQAVPIVINAKAQRPGVCNAMETLLLDSGLSRAVQKKYVQALLEQKVTLFGDSHIQSLDPRIKKASESDWDAEYLDLRLAVKSVKGIDEAIRHINTWSSHHTDAILTKSSREIKQFLRQVDSSSVIANASTRFADGGEYGMGCEIGISTDKLHSRGPMGVEDLTTYKWIVEGQGQIRE